MRQRNSRRWRPRATHKCGIVPTPWRPSSWSTSMDLVGGHQSKAVPSTPLPARAIAFTQLRENRPPMLVILREGGDPGPRAMSSVALDPRLRGEDGGRLLICKPLLDRNLARTEMCESDSLQGVGSITPIPVRQLANLDPSTPSSRLQQLRGEHADPCAAPRHNAVDRLP